MSGSKIEIIKESDLPPNGVRTMVLVGRTGNGKSATGNSILGRRAFKSKASSSGVTDRCELQRTVLRDGRIINVIDTPGLFDLSTDSEFSGQEIVRCIDLAKDGIHAILVVFSVRNRFSQEEEASLRRLHNLFGSKVFDYMIVAFTGGDELEDNEETLEDYLGRECPEPLKEIISICKNRVVLFDNKTRDKGKKSEQVEKLLFHVDAVIAQNGGKPYTDELFAKTQEARSFRDRRLKDELERDYSKHGVSKLKDMIEKAYEEQLRRIIEMVDSKLNEARREQQLEAERAARIRAEERARSTQEKTDAEIRKLRKKIKKVQRQSNPCNNL